MSKITKRKLLLALLTMTSASALSLGMTACANGAGDAKHLFTDANWGSDETNHWHKCLEDGCTETQGTEGHKWGTPRQTKAPTCYSFGEQTTTCTVCGYDKKEPIAMVQHNWSKAWDNDDEQHFHKCTNEKCTANTDAAAHGDWVDVTVVEEATCTEDGYKQIKCGTCDYVTTEAIPATGHNGGENKTITQQPTCTEDGEETGTCETCGEEYTAVIPASGHTAGESTVTKTATCTEDGVKTITCTVCEETYTEVIPATGHDWTEWAIVGETASCTDETTRSRHCQNEGCEEVEEKQFPAGSHRYGDWDVTQEATCEADGSRTHTCTVCGDEATETIPSPGHRYTQWFISLYPSETSTGTAVKYCEGDSAHNIVVELPELSATQAGYEYDEEKGLYNCTVPHAMGDITFKTYNIETIEDAVQVALDTQKQVITSTARRENIIVGHADENSDELVKKPSSREIKYELGTNYVHIYDGSEKINYYYSLNDDDTLFAVMKRWVGERVEFELVEKDTTATKESLNGYGYGFTFMTNGVTYNGLGTFINYLYTIGKNNVNKDFVSQVKTVNDKQVYSFSYGYMAGKYFDVIEVEFSFDDNFIVSDATLNVKTYAIRESAADNRIPLSDPLLTQDEEGHYYYDGKLLVSRVDQVESEDPDQEVGAEYTYPVVNGDYLENANAYIDTDGTPRMRVAYDKIFEQLPDGTYRVVSGREEDWANSETFIVKQTSKLEEGASLPTNPYKYEDFIISSYDIVRGETPVEEDQEIIINANESLILTIPRDSVLPTTYNPYFDTFTVTLVDEDGNIIEGTGTTNLTDGEIGYFFYSGFNGDGKLENEKEDDYSISIKSLLAGEWTLFIRTEKTELRLHLIVNAIAPNPLYTEVREYNDLTDKESWNRTITKTDVYQGQEVVFRGVVGHPAYENGKYSVSVTKDGEDVTGTCLNMTAVDGLALYTFSAQELGDYTVTLSPQLGLPTSFNVTVKEAPNVTEMLDGEFGNADKGYQVTLSPTEGGALSGTATIVKGYDDATETTVISYSYDETTRTFTCEYVSGAVGDFVQGQQLPYNYGLKLSSAYKLYLTYESGFSGERVSVLIGGFENALVCTDSIILAKAESQADKLVANVSGIYRITSNNTYTFISVNGAAYAEDENGEEIRQLSRLDGTFELYVGDYVKIWNIMATGATYSIELVEAFEMVYVGGVDFEDETATLRVDDTLTLTPVFTPENTTQRGLNWTSSDASVATVDDNGVVTGVGKGTVTITATTTNGKYSASIEITVIGSHELIAGENSISFTGPFWNEIYTFEGEEGKTYTVKAVTSGFMGGNVVYNGITYSFPATLEISGESVALDISSFSYGEGAVTVTITEKIAGVVTPNYDALEVGDNPVSVSSYDNYYFTIVGEPYTIYEVTSTGSTYSSTFYALKGGEPDYSNSGYTLRYTTDENGFADICMWPGDVPSNLTVTVTKIGDAPRPNFDTLNVGEKTVNVYPDYIYYTIVGNPNAKYTVTVGPDATLYAMINGEYDLSNNANGTMEYTTDENGFADICFFPGQGPGDYTITVEKYVPKPTRTVTATAPTYGQWGSEEVTVGDLDENGIILQIDGTTAGQTLVISCYDADLGDDIQNVDIYADGQDTNYTVTITCTGNDTVIIASNGGTLHNVVVKMLDW